MATKGEQNEATAAQVSDQPPPSTGTKSYSFTVTLFEQFGRAFLSWALTPGYAIGDKDLVQLWEGSTWVSNWPVTALTGTQDTSHVWGSGLIGAYVAYNYEPAPGEYVRLVGTPPTQE
jgi:hypothetical protein